MIYQTRDHYELYDAEKERKHGPDDALESYFDEDGEDEVALTTSEREDFETDDRGRLRSDVLDHHTFDRLVTWLREGDLLHKD